MSENNKINSESENIINNISPSKEDENNNTSEEEIIIIDNIEKKENNKENDNKNYPIMRKIRKE